MKSKKGFTLIEMITVIVLLGVVSVGIFGFIKTSTQIYIDVSNRDELIASARFAIERLNREVRNALPNSVRVTTDAGSTKQCIEFYPIITSVAYIDIPVAPEPASTTATFAYNGALSFPSINANTQVAVYPLFANELYNNSARMASVQSVALLGAPTNNEWQLTLAGAHLFTDESPTQRLYFIDEAVSYCAQTNGELWRHQGYSVSATLAPSTHGVLMAEYLNLVTSPVSFQVTQATLLRNSSILIKLAFDRQDEMITFNNEVQVRNVP